MNRRAFLTTGVTVTLLAGCLEGDSGSAEIAISGGYVERQSSGVFEVVLELERTGASGEYAISIQLSDESGTIVRRQLSDQVNEGTDRWKATKRIDLADIDGVSELGAAYEATAQVKDSDADTVELERRESYGTSSSARQSATSDE
ncbi:hypothetical protein [Haloarcula salinisoli]|uniref:Uncharacterized protein n=1 Tax=Haloarcula salinisoli TaxID=2487746 RepID=A0A8J8C7Q4_9EURY|nr:hypothetical protein [Halomicroarcula salinisoli]MBX0284985.1 hypothetical protein [Halomicroarcula salinisoli]MBX0303537.1 hypothetical protein [Halomicroarcula salinisoli]